MIGPKGQLLSSVPGESYREHAIIPYGISLHLKATRNIARLLRTSERNELMTMRVSRWFVRGLKRSRSKLPEWGFVPVSDISISIQDAPQDGFYASRLIVKLDIVDDFDGTLRRRFGGRLRATPGATTAWIAHGPLPS